MSPIRTLLLAALVLLPSLPVHAEAPPDRRIAITVDDLPWASFGDDTPAGVPVDVQAAHARLVQAIRATPGPVTGFVNEGKLDAAGTEDPARLRMLRDWLDAGATLGNHTRGHTDLHAAGLAAYQADILAGERRLRPLLAEVGQVPRWFRHPYLRAGRSAEDKAALQAFLAGHGYRIAPVTVDNSDWIWSRAYDRAAGDDALRQRLRDGYAPYMLAKLDYYETFSVTLLGHALPQVWLLHANTLNADAWPALMAGLRERGYRIVSLDEALKDPAYARDDGYTGAWGPSWLHRWAIAEKKPRDFFAGEPATPGWVLEVAGVDGE